MGRMLANADRVKKDGPRRVRPRPSAEPDGRRTNLGADSPRDGQRLAQRYGKLSPATISPRSTTRAPGELKEVQPIGPSLDQGRARRRGQGPAHMGDPAAEGARKSSTRAPGRVSEVEASNGNAKTCAAWSRRHDREEAAVIALSSPRRQAKRSRCRRLPHCHTAGGRRPVAGGHVRHLAGTAAELSSPPRSPGRPSPALVWSVAERAAPPSRAPPVDPASSSPNRFARRGSRATRTATATAWSRSKASSRASPTRRRCRSAPW